jgi:hypothetical protein
MIDDILKTATPYLLAALSAIVWLIRPEGTVKKIELNYSELVMVGAPRIRDEN